MNIVVIDYRLCAFTYSFHAKKPFEHTFFGIAKLLNKVGVKPSKIVFAVDIGTPKRREIYPEYKTHRAKKHKQESKAEQDRRKSFEVDYKNSLKWLHHFGAVIDINGLEADDVGSIVANRFKDSDKYNVILVSSDKDWASFLFSDNIKLLHVKREKLITRSSCEQEYGLDPTGILYLQVFAGSDKENVKGIYRLGEKTFKKFYEEEKEFNRLAQNIATAVENGQNGMKLPENTSFMEILDMNYALFNPISINDIDEEEQVIFSDKFLTSQSTYDDMLNDLSLNYSTTLLLSPDQRAVYKL
jgi:5'-3' exonuclease